MEPEPRSIELKLISCKNIKAFNFFQKLTLYATVFLSSEDPDRDLTEQQKQLQRTLTDRQNDGDGTNPEWIYQARFDFGCLSQRDFRHLFFSFEFRHDGVILGDKLIGECRVSLADLVRDVDGVARFVSYEVRSADGKPNGIFNFSYKLNGFGNRSSHILEGRISGYPILSPEDCVPNPNQSRVQYPTSQIEYSCCHPPVASDIYRPAVAPPVTSGIYHPAVAPPVASGICHPAVAPPVASDIYHPAVAPPVASDIYHPAVAPPVSSPSCGECNYYYPPAPPPPACPYPHPRPPPPPPRPVVQAYPYYGPAAHHWPPGPYLEPRW